MAKKKVSSSLETPDACCSYSPTIYIDFDDLKEISGLTVGEEIKVVIKGKVKSVEQRERYDDPKKTRASISLKDFDAEIVDGMTDIEKLFDDEED